MSETRDEGIELSRYARGVAARGNKRICARSSNGAVTSCQKISGSRSRFRRQAAKASASANAGIHRRRPDSAYEIFIRADLFEPEQVLGVLIKELVHTLLPADAGHGKEFRTAAMRIGLEGPMRQATPGPLLRERLQELAVSLGPLPHAQLYIEQQPTDDPGLDRCRRAEEAVDALSQGRLHRSDVSVHGSGCDVACDEYWPAALSAAWSHGGRRGGC